METMPLKELELYMGETVKITNGVTIKSPELLEIAEMGEDKYFSIAQTLCATPSSMKLMLHKGGYDWMQVSDFQLFMMLSQALPQSETSILLGDLDLQSLKPHQLLDSEEVALANDDGSIVITEIIYELLVSYIRKMHNFKKQVDKAGNEITKTILLRVAEDDAKKAQDKPFKSFLRPIVSAVKCRMGYSMDYVKKMNIFELMDDVSRLQMIVQADAALGGAYSGMVDTKKIDKSIFDWMKEITEESSTKGKSILNEGAN